MKIYKTLCDKYTDFDIKHFSGGVVTFVSFSRLVECSVKEAVGLKGNETIIGVVVDDKGVLVYIETKIVEDGN